MLSQDKKGLSIMVGYVLLVVIAIVMSLLVYQWVKTYIPKDAIECPEGSSMFIKEVVYDCGTDSLDVTVKNNGLFSLAGFFIYATTNEDAELATEDLSGKVDIKLKHGNSIVFGLEGIDKEKNTLTPDSPGNEKTIKFTDVADLKGLRIEIIPIRWQEVEGKIRLASCSDAKIGQEISCYVPPPEDCTDERTDAEVCGSRECGTTLDDCEISRTCLPNDCEISDPGEGLVCDGAIGTCVLPEACTDTCADVGAECGTVCEEVCTDTCDSITEECAGTTCITIPYCGDGNIDLGETCDDGEFPAQGDDGCSSTCQTETDWLCVGEPSDCSFCNSNDICETSLGEDCACSACDGKKDGCPDNYVCDFDTKECVEMDAVESCEQFCAYLGYDNSLSFCASNCGGGCPGICEPYDISEYCNPRNPSSPHYCCCVPFD